MAALDQISKVIQSVWILLLFLTLIGGAVLKANEDIAENKRANARQDEQLGSHEDTFEAIEKNLRELRRIHEKEQDVDEAERALIKKLCRQGKLDDAEACAAVSDQ